MYTNLDVFIVWALTIAVVATTVFAIAWGGSFKVLVTANVLAFAAFIPWVLAGSGHVTIPVTIPLLVAYWMVFVSTVRAYTRWDAYRSMATLDKNLDAGSLSRAYLGGRPKVAALVRSRGADPVEIAHNEARRIANLAIKRGLDVITVSYSENSRSVPVEDSIEARAALTSLLEHRNRWLLGLESSKYAFAEIFGQENMHEDERATGAFHGDGVADSDTRVHDNDTHS